MTILAIDTSGRVASVALANCQEILAEFQINYNKTHSETLMPMISQMFSMSGIAKESVDYIACASGPGSFTGLRIGASAAIGLARGLGVPIIPVPTLDFLAYNMLTPDLICPIMDARRQQVYTAFYRYEENRLKRLTEYAAEPVAQVLEKARSYQSKVCFLGDGVFVHAEQIKNDVFYTAPPHLNLQRGASLAALSYHYTDRAVACDAFSLFYLRKPQAERELEERNRI